MEFIIDTYTRESIEEAPKVVLKSISVRVDMESGKHWIFEGLLNEKSKTAWIFGPKNYIAIDLKKGDPENMDSEISVEVEYEFEKLTGIKAEIK